ncbi:hypothetical protein JB92DRAFT_3092668 [Gautieria morchelliformis]|nr:hypothetical protein JB92DRAFT_3092668 [Gautieria morchelliformis]
MASTRLLTKRGEPAARLGHGDGDGNGDGQDACRRRRELPQLADQPAAWSRRRAWVPKRAKVKTTRAQRTLEGSDDQSEAVTRPRRLADPVGGLLHTYATRAATAAKCGAGAARGSDPGGLQFHFQLRRVAQDFQLQGIAPHGAGLASAYYRSGPITRLTRQDPGSGPGLRTPRDRSGLRPQDPSLMTGRGVHNNAQERTTRKHGANPAIGRPALHSARRPGHSPPTSSFSERSPAETPARAYEGALGPPSACRGQHRVAYHTSKDQPSRTNRSSHRKYVVVPVISTPRYEEARRLLHMSDPEKPDRANQHSARSSRRREAIVPHQGPGRRHQVLAQARPTGGGKQIQDTNFKTSSDGYDIGLV